MTGAALLAAAWLCAPALAQDVGSARVVPIQVTGDADARFSIVVLGDGYTAAELPRFRAHVDKHLNVLWSIEPFRSYRSYVNVYAVEIVSADSGVTCDPAVRRPKRTPLAAQFDGGCSDPNARAIDVDMDAARSYAARATPHADQILVIANTDTYGGIGGRVATTSGGNALGPLITPHELGHSLGGLQDEYTYRARGKPGGPYSGDEPASVHLTLLDEDDMREQRKKWWRWLGEVSEAGGTIGRFEGGASRTTGIWRPSRHSMMISLGYYFDQVGRERMTQRISEQVSLIASSTPDDRTIGSRDILWIETAQPLYHALDVVWDVDGIEIERARNRRTVDLGGIARTGSTVTVTVVDPTEFVRDPEIRSKALTARKSWRVGADSSLPPALDVAFTASTPTGRPIGALDVVYVTTTQPADRMLDVTWRLNGEPVPHAADGRTFSLARHSLAAGTHRLRATVSDPQATDGQSETREWIVDNTTPTMAYRVSVPLATVQGAERPHLLVRDEFTLALDPSDDQSGYVVAEFRVNGDGWHHYYGWPDAPPGSPFRFTPRGTTIKALVYGSLSSEGLSPQPWEPREPGWGTHLVEYRGIDAAGNIGPVGAFHVTIEPSPACTRTVGAPHAGDLHLDTGVLCVIGGTVTGNVSLGTGASLTAVDARISGSIAANGAQRIEVISSTVGALRVGNTKEALILFGSTVLGEASLAGVRAKHAMLVAGNTFRAAVSCPDDRPPIGAPVTPNVFEGGVTGRCD